MAKPVATRNALVDAQLALGKNFSLHTADPGTTGASEATGGSPAYARKASTMPVASAGSSVGSQVTIDVPAGTFTHWGEWSAITAGTFVDGGALPASETFAAQGQYLLTPTVSAPA